jgi:hypothetical protein
MKITETPTIAVPEVLMGLILVHLAHDRNHTDQNVAYVAIRLDNACRDLLRADYGRLRELGATHLIDEARRNLGQI